MNKVYLVLAKRTALGSFNGSLSSIPATEFGGLVVKNIMDSCNLDPSAIDEVIVGNILPAGIGQGPGRQVALKAGIPVETPGYSINMVCGSGMKAVMNAYTNVKAGISNLIIAGGTENMSSAPYVLPNVRQGLRLGNAQVIDHLVYDALTDAYDGIHMGITAENIAQKYSITREEQDAFSFISQQKAISSIDSGRFKDEIVPIEIKTRKGTIVFDTDEYPNRNTDLDKLATLRPAFKKDGTVTAGNASGINDGAAFCLIASEEAIKKYNLVPMAEICAIGQGGVEPQVMGLGPVPAIKNVLVNANLTLSNMDLLELNEAFAAQSLGVIRELVATENMSYDEISRKTNVNGGSIALGHPVGASGCRIITTLVHEMKKRKSTYGVASLCIGGGMGTAIILKLAD